jgi:hypothetical protein
LKGLKILLYALSVIFITNKLQGQIVTQTYLDPCDLKTYVITIPIQSNNGVVIVIRGVSKVFTYVQFSNGEVDDWIKSIFATPCTPTIVASQAVTTTVTQSVSAAASMGVASASIPSSGAPVQTKSESEPQSSSSESKSDEKKSEEKKKDDKKKGIGSNPMILASDLTTSEGPDLKYNVIASFGISKTSMVGNESWGINTMIWSTLKQFALSGGYTKMDFKNGKIENIHSYSMTLAYLDGNYMNLIGYTNITPNLKYGTYGYNVGIVTLLVKDNEYSDLKIKEVRNTFNISFTTSVVGFWTRPFIVNRKTTLSPQIFLMNTPINWNSKTGETTVNRQIGFLFGSSFDYKISKRFGLSLNYKISGSTQKNTPILNNFLIGSRLII